MLKLQPSLRRSHLHQSNPNLFSIQFQNNSNHRKDKSLGIQDLEKVLIQHRKSGPFNFDPTAFKKSYNLRDCASEKHFQIEKQFLTSRNPKKAQTKMGGRINFSKRKAKPSRTEGGNVGGKVIQEENPEDETLQNNFVPDQFFSQRNLGNQIDLQKLKFETGKTENDRKASDLGQISRNAGSEIRNEYVQEGINVDDFMKLIGEGKTESLERVQSLGVGVDPLAAKKNASGDLLERVKSDGTHQKSGGSRDQQKSSKRRKRFDFNEKSKNRSKISQTIEASSEKKKIEQAKKSKNRLSNGIQHLTSLEKNKQILRPINAKKKKAKESNKNTENNLKKTKNCFQESLNRINSQDMLTDIKTENNPSPEIKIKSITGSLDFDHDLSNLEEDFADLDETLKNPLDKSEYREDAVDFLDFEDSRQDLKDWEKEIQSDGIDFKIEKKFDDVFWEGNPGLDFGKENLGADFIKNLEANLDSQGVIDGNKDSEIEKGGVKFTPNKNHHENNLEKEKNLGCNDQAVQIKSENSDDGNSSSDSGLGNLGFNFMKYLEQHGQKRYTKREIKANISWSSTEYDIYNPVFTDESGSLRELKSNASSNKFYLESDSDADSKKSSQTPNHSKNSRKIKKPKKKAKRKAKPKSKPKPKPKNSKKKKNLTEKLSNAGSSKKLKHNIKNHNTRKISHHSKNLSGFHSHYNPDGKSRTASALQSQRSSNNRNPKPRHFNKIKKRHIKKEFEIRGENPHINENILIQMSGGMGLPLSALQIFDEKQNSNFKNNLHRPKKKPLNLREKEAKKILLESEDLDESVDFETAEDSEREISMRTQSEYTPEHEIRRESFSSDSIGPQKESIIRITDCSSARKSESPESSFVQMESETEINKIDPGEYAHLKMKEGQRNKEGKTKNLGRVGKIKKKKNYVSVLDKKKLAARASHDTARISQRIRGLLEKSRVKSKLKSESQKLGEKKSQNSEKTEKTEIKAAKHPILKTAEIRDLIWQSCDGPNKRKDFASLKKMKNRSRFGKKDHWGSGLAEKSESNGNIQNAKNFPQRRTVGKLGRRLKDSTLTNNSVNFSLFQRPKLDAKKNYSFQSKRYQKNSSDKDFQKAENRRQRRSTEEIRTEIYAGYHPDGNLYSKNPQNPFAHSKQEAQGGSSRKSKKIGRSLDFRNQRMIQNFRFINGNFMFSKNSGKSRAPLDKILSKSAKIEHPKIGEAVRRKIGRKSIDVAVKKHEDSSPNYRSQNNNQVSFKKLCQKVGKSGLQKKKRKVDKNLKLRHSLNVTGKGVSKNRLKDLGSRRKGFKISEKNGHFKGKDGKFLENNENDRMKQKNFKLKGQAVSKIFVNPK